MTKKILFLTFSKRAPDRYWGDPSVIYRCFNPAEELRRRGYQVFVEHAELHQGLKGVDLVVFHRPQIGPALKKWIREYHGLLKLADFDDCLFDPSIIKSHPALLSGKMSRSILRAEVEKYYRALTLFQHFSVSSPVLAAVLIRRLEELGKQYPVFVHRNGLSLEWLAYASQFDGWKPGQPRRVSYFAGNGNHQADFDLVDAPISQFISQSSDAKCVLYGDIVSSHLANSPKVERRSRRNFYDLVKETSRTWVAIAPLQHSVFNRCKSAIKFLEAGALGVPVIAHPHPEYEPLKNSGLLICESKKWGEQLRELKEGKIYREASQAAKRRARKEIVSNTIEPFLDWLHGAEI